jgi:thiol-disulfide isomerase/thioredoxin
METAAVAGEAEDGVTVPAVAAPEFPEGVQWVQGGPLNFADLRGRVTVLHFWTNGCINCIHNYPTYRAWQEKYADKEVTLVGVHTPEFRWEAPAERVRQKARANGLKFPIVLDTGSRIWEAWGNRYWPSVYLIDRQGRVRYRWEGELHLDTAAGRRFARHIDELLAEKP